MIRDHDRLQFKATQRAFPGRVLGKEDERRFDVQPAAVNRVGAAVGNAGVRRAVVGDDARSESNLGSANE